MKFILALLGLLWTTTVEADDMAGSPQWRSLDYYAVNYGVRADGTTSDDVALKKAWEASSLIDVTCSQY